MILFQMSSVFVILFALALFLFVPGKWRWLFLLLLSLDFLYALNTSGLVLAAAQTVVAYGMSLLLQRKKNALLLAVFIVIQLAPLILIRLQEQAPAANPLAVLSFWGIRAGVSFYTFQIIATLIEIYWGRRNAERHFGRFALYVLFFANKLVGPIERPSLMDSFKTIELPSPRGLFRAAFLIWLGLFQKFVLADQIGAYVEPVFREPKLFEGFPVTFSVLLSKYQIFCDFSGASLIALGLAGLFGVALTPNFDRPFAARSLGDFWRRWHISLQTWIRDYVFYPLLSTRASRFGVLGPLILTFIIFGLWHDFRWTFVVYGILQGLLVWSAPERLFKKFRKKSAIAMVLVFNYVFLIAWPSVLFRAQTFSEAWAVWSNMGLDTHHLGDFFELGHLKIRVLFLLVVFHELFLWLDATRGLSVKLSERKWPVRMIATVALLLILLLFAKIAPEKGTFFYAIY